MSPLGSPIHFRITSGVLSRQHMSWLEHAFLESASASIARTPPNPQVPIPLCPYSQHAISSTPEPLRACIPYSPPDGHTSTPFPNLSIGSCLGSRYTCGRHTTVIREVVWYASTLRPFFCPFRCPCSAHKGSRESEAKRTQGITPGIAQGITHSSEHPRHMTSDPFGGVFLRRAARQHFTWRPHLGQRESWRAERTNDP